MTPTDPFGLVGQVLDGQFRVEKLVGEGGFSAVYRGHHLGLDEPVAIKCLKLPPALGAQLVDSFVQRFRDESRILYRLSQGNLHIVRSIGAGAAKSLSATSQGLVVPYMVLEWLEGRSMASEFAVRKTLGKSGRTLDDVLALFASAADALAFAHAQGVVHRDLNPGNLFLAKTPQGEKMKVLDFGVAKILDDTTLNLGPRAQTMGQIRIFAPAYGSPEQFDDALGAVASPSDVYSFALVLMEALRDKPVNDGSNLGEFATAAIDANKRPTPRSLGLNLPDAVEQVFAKATRLKPVDRYANVGEMWKALEAAVKTKAASNRPPAGRPGAATAQGIGGGPMSRTLPLNSPNLTLPRPAIGLPSKVGAPGSAPGPSTATSKLRPATLPSSSPGASPLSASLPGVGNAKAPSTGGGAGSAPPATQRFAGAGGAGSSGLPAPPPRAAIAGARPAPSPLGAPPPKVHPPSQSAQRPAKKMPSEPPLHEDEELPTRVGQSPLTDALPSDPPKALQKAAKNEEEEEDVTRVREPGEDLLAAAAAAAATVGSDGNSSPPGAGPSGAKPERPSPIPPPPDSGHTLMMPPGGGGIPMPPPQQPMQPPPQPFAPSPSASIDAAPMSPHGHPPLPGQGGLGSTVALASGSGISDLRATPYQPLQPPPYVPPHMQQGGMPQASMQPGQPMHSTPFPGTPQMGVPAHFAHGQPPQFAQGGYPASSHSQPGFADAAAQPAHQAHQPQQGGGGKAPVGLIIAAVAFLVIALGGIGVFFFMGRSGATTTDDGTSPSAAPTPVPVPSPVPSPVVTTPPVVDPNGPSSAQPVADNSSGAAPTPADNAPATPTTTTTTATPTTTAAPANTANPTPTNAGGAGNAPTPINPVPTPVNPTPGTATAKPVPTAAPAADPNAWNEGAARARLGQANGVLVFCKKPDEPTGPGSASITFSPEGAVTNVTLDPPYAGTKAGECVAGQFRRAKVNAFQGSSQTIKHTFDVPK